MDIFTRKFKCNLLSGITMLSLLFNSLHKGNVYTLWKLWNLEEVGTKTRFANWKDQVMLLDGRRSYTKVSVNCFVLLLYVLTIFFLFSLNITLMECKAWSCSNFHMKGIFKHFCKVGVELHRECFRYIFLWIAANLSSTFDKGNNT